jgi:hypothetical protein
MPAIIISFLAAIFTPLPMPRFHASEPIDSIIADIALSGYCCHAITCFRH